MALHLSGWRGSGLGLEFVAVFCDALVVFPLGCVLEFFAPALPVAISFRVLGFPVLAVGAGFAPCVFWRPLVAVVAVCLVIHRGRL